jgi:hypothetical protein
MLVDVRLILGAAPDEPRQRVLNGTHTRFQSRDQPPHLLAERRYLQEPVRQVLVAVMAGPLLVQLLAERRSLVSARSA